MVVGKVKITPGRAIDYATVGGLIMLGLVKGVTALATWPEAGITQLAADIVTGVMVAMIGATVIYGVGWIVHHGITENHNEILAQQYYDMLWEARMKGVAKPQCSVSCDTRFPECVPRPDNL